VGETLTVILSSIPGVLTAIVGSLLIYRKQKAELTAADRKAEFEVNSEERDDVIGHMRKLMGDRAAAHRKDIERVDAQLGMVVHKLSECEDKHKRSEIINARLIEFMRVRDLMTETQEHQLFRESEAGEGGHDAT
jgi:hypothetical protein